MPIWEYIVSMARPAAHSDPFNAIAEPTRRELVELLAQSGPSSVSALVDHVKLPQPTVSKHLGVLRRAGLVDAEHCGRQRLYRIRGEKLKHIHEWISTFEQFWSHQLDQIRLRAERAARLAGTESTHRETSSHVDHHT